MTRGFAWAIALATSLLATSGHAADTPAVEFSTGRNFTEQGGEQLYHAICQACHMADGQGAHGAADYPALAGNPRLASASYLALTVLRGRRDMPAFGAMLSDDQVAAVTAYVRTHLGNHESDMLTPADVATLRSLLR